MPEPMQITKTRACPEGCFGRSTRGDLTAWTMGAALASLWHAPPTRRIDSMIHAFMPSIVRTMSCVFDRRRHS